MNESHQWVPCCWCSHSTTFIGFVRDFCSDHRATGLNIPKWSSAQRDHFCKSGAWIVAIFAFCARRIDRGPWWKMDTYHWASKLLQSSSDARSCLDVPDIVRGTVGCSVVVWFCVLWWWGHIVMCLSIVVNDLLLTNHLQFLVPGSTADGSRSGWNPEIL